MFLGLLAFPFFEVYSYWSIQRLPLWGNVIKSWRTCCIGGNLPALFFSPTSYFSFSLLNPINVIGVLSRSSLSIVWKKNLWGRKRSLRLLFCGCVMLAAFRLCCLLLREENLVSRNQAHSNRLENGRWGWVKGGVMHSLFQKNSQQSSKDFQLCSV